MAAASPGAQTSGTGVSRFAGHVIGELTALVAVGALIGFFFGIAQPKDRWSIALYASVIALASSAVGGLLGLLFGIPRALAGSPTSPAPGVTPASGPEASQQSATKSHGYSANTNLEQVSDWLTKLLLGAGLTQLARLPGSLQHLGSFLAPELGGGNGNSFAVTLVVFNLLAGFFLAFLATRLRLGAAFREADELAADAAATSTAIGLLPPAPVGPTMLQVNENTAPDEKKAALALSQRVQRIEQQTAVSAFDPEAYRRVAQQLVSAALYQQAIQLLELGMEQHPDDPSLPLYMGAIYGMYLDDFASADQAYFRALAIKQDYAPAYYDLACNAARRADIESSRAYLVQAYNLDSTMRDQSLNDPVWDELHLRTDPRLADLVGPTVEARGGVDKQ